MNFQNNKKNRGFSLLELILAIAIFSLSSFAIATMLIDSNLSTKSNTERIEALLYTKEGIEAARSIRDNNWDTWVALSDGDYGLATTSSSTWAFIGTSDYLDDKYTRVINVTSDPVASTTKEVSVNVSWNLTPVILASTTLKTILTNWTAVDNTPASIPTNGLVSYWSFDGNADDSVSGNNGVLSYGTALAAGTKGLANTAYYFDGVDDMIEVTTTNNIPTTGPRTFVAWIKYNSANTPAWGNIMTIGGGNLCTQSSIFPFGVDTDTNIINYSRHCSYTPNTPLTASGLGNSEWHMLTTGYDGTNFFIYVDGNLLTSTPGSDYSYLKDFIRFGSVHTSIGVYAYKGFIDEVRVYNRAITAGEVLDLYNQDKPASYTITFDGNNSDGGSMSGQTISEGSSANLSTNAYTRTDHTFDSWNTAADGSGTSYADEESYVMGSGDVILYAQWLEVVDACAGTPLIGTVCVDETVYVSSTLRTTPADAPTTYVWSTEQIITLATSTSDGAGNTVTLAGLVGSYPAADYCDELGVYNYNDWYLPAKDELNVLYNNKVAIGGFIMSVAYWSSTEGDNHTAWNQFFGNGGQGAGNKSFTISVRCVRSI